MLLDHYLISEKDMASSGLQSAASDAGETGRAQSTRTQRRMGQRFTSNFNERTAVPTPLVSNVNPVV
jgi:hypothetical protein